MVLLASDFDQSKYLKAGDLGDVGAEKRLKIRIVTKETGVGEREETKACVWFTTTDKGLLLNKTNLRTLQSALGNDMSLWSDKIIVVFVTMTNFRGQMSPALRVRIPPPKDAYRAPAAPVEPKPAAAPVKATPPAPVDEDVDGFEDEPELDDISDLR